MSLRGGDGPTDIAGGGDGLSDTAGGDKPSDIAGAGQTK